MNFVKRILLKFILGKNTYEYMVRSILHDPRSKKLDANIDLLISQDGMDKRIEADWVKKIAKIVSTISTENKASEYRVKYENM